jgi:hypothetical protein
VTAHRPVRVPVAWLCAQDSASALIAAGGHGWPRSSFESRAAHDVLALTVLLTGFGRTGGLPAPFELGVLQRLLMDDVEWAVWCQSVLDGGAPGLTEADVTAAGAAWQWLSHGRLLGGTLVDLCSPCDPVSSLHGVGVSVGVAEARKAVGTGFVHA